MSEIKHTSLQELLTMKPDEVKKLDIVEQLIYWQAKYEEVCHQIRQMIKDAPERK